MVLRLSPHNLVCFSWMDTPWITNNWQLKMCLQIEYLLHRRHFWDCLQLIRQHNTLFPTYLFKLHIVNSWLNFVQRHYIFSRNTLEMVIFVTCYWISNQFSPNYIFGDMIRKCSLLLVRICASRYLNEGPRCSWS